MAVNPNMTNVRAEVEDDVPIKVVEAPIFGAAAEPTPTTQVPANLFQKLVKFAPAILQTSALRDADPPVVSIKLEAVPDVPLVSSWAYCTVPETVNV